MSNFGGDGDSEVDRIMTDRPPSSYGSMMSEDHEDSDDSDEPPEQMPKVSLEAPTGVRLYRSESPETAITERTHTNQSSVHKEGVFLNQHTSIHRVEALARQQREPTMLEPSEHQCDVRTDIIRRERETEDENNDRQTELHEREIEEVNEGDMQEVQNKADVQEKSSQREMDDLDEIVVDLGFSELEPPPPPPEGVGLQFQHPHRSLTLRHVFTAMVKSLTPLKQGEFTYFKRSLCSHGRFKHDYSTIAEISDALDLADKLIELCGMGETLYVTIRSLANIHKVDLSNTLRKTCKRALLRYELRLTHERQYYTLYEGCCWPGQQRYISDVYTEPLTVIRGNTDLVNTEHEFRKVPCTVQETGIRAADIFRPLPNEEKTIRTVMMSGVPASGLTVAVNKFIIDWMEGNTNQDFQLLFPLPGKELHLGKKGDKTFLEMVANFFVEAKDIRFIEKADCLSLFIIDALDLCHYPLDFQNNENITSVQTKASVDTLITSLIKGSILPQARVWITSHRTAAHKIPSQFIDRFVELRGFTDEQKEIYFTKRTSEPQLGRNVLNHMTRSRALKIICHLPLFCWMVAYIFERSLRDPEFGKHPPGITNFYLQYVLIQMSRSFERYRGSSVEAHEWKDEDKMFVEKMAKMAFRMLQEGRDTFSVEDLHGVGLKYEDLHSRDEITTEVKRTSEDQRTWLFKFVHYTIQEFMAAMYVYVAFRKHGKNVFEKNPLTKMLGKDRPLIELYRPTINRALSSQNGHLDIFLRFLVGLMTPGTEEHLHGYLLHHCHPKPKRTEEVVKYIYKKIKENIHPERCRNLELCLVELEDGKNDR
ncbi:NLR family CARD domain-containing protein 3-like [Xyrauchen texanus]|uniref:NLR family CARD domain-containing protein 3-like n=1 Tax=Xyrauchen texanus TaxID=154827 RepID=UPI0022422272|nr:NLR family CARD domain-containing protein 3-like [Xyrauchen texanus]XP_051962663.1 NLR family CARD domain-containing protein 3-like [Xyrauchen texanus]